MELRLTCLYLTQNMLNQYPLISSLYSNLNIEFNAKILNTTAPLISNLTKLISCWALSSLLLLMLLTQIGLIVFVMRSSTRFNDNTIFKLCLCHMKLVAHWFHLGNLPQSVCVMWWFDIDVTLVHWECNSTNLTNTEVELVWIIQNSINLEFKEFYLQFHIKYMRPITNILQGYGHM